VSKKNNQMIIIGLTGGIGSGKTTISNHLKKMNFPVFDSDLEVKKIYIKKDPSLIRIIKKIDKNGLSIKKNKINKKVLGQIVFSSPKKLKLLELTIYKKLNTARMKFIKKNKNMKKKLVVLDTPLLFEKKLNKICDYTILAFAPKKIRTKRVMKRPNMNKDRLNKIIQRQMPEAKKRKLSNFVVHTYLGKWYSKKELKQIIGKILKQHKP
tara:strand:- start:1121 stop:1750 length:630 start_codon:yes stop_codon:yes gene_type:complete